VKRENNTTVTINTVKVIGQGGKPTAFKIVQCLLEYYTTNITALKLQLSFEPTLHMLQHLEFTNLTIFETNIPHTIIVPFLGKHPTITNLVLSVCNIGAATIAIACPLTTCHLPHLKQLSCPKGCVQPLLSAVALASLLYNLQVVQHTAQDSMFPLKHLFDYRHILMSSYLYYLHVDFDHKDSDLL